MWGKFDVQMALSGLPPLWGKVGMGKCAVAAFIKSLLCILKVIVISSLVLAAD